MDGTEMLLDCILYSAYCNGMEEPQFDEKNRFPVEMNGRKGHIKKWANGTFGTYFVQAGKRKRNIFSTFEKARKYLERELTRRRLIIIGISSKGEIVIQLHGAPESLRLSRPNLRKLALTADKWLQAPNGWRNFRSRYFPEED